MFLIIAQVNADGTVQKYNDAATEAEAVALVEKLKTEKGYTGAFYVPHPGSGPQFWRADTKTKTVSIAADKEAVFLEEKVQSKRRDEYSKIDGEGMDAIRKAIESLAGFLVTDLPAEYQAYAGKVEAIKDRHPKPVK